MASADILRAAHSPLPWALKLEGPRSRPQVVCPDPEDVEWPWVVAKCEGAAPNDATGKNNAAFIVRACNAHYQMLEALKDISRAIEAKRQIWGRDLSADMRDRMLCCNDKHFRRAEEKVRAAIAAAEAEAGR